jgi:hypothetical protein
MIFFTLYAPKTGYSLGTERLAKRGVINRIAAKPKINIGLIHVLMSAPISKSVLADKTERIKQTANFFAKEIFFVINQIEIFDFHRHHYIRIP